MKQSRKPGADTCFSPDEIDESLISGAKIFHFCPLSLTDEPVASAARQAIELAKAGGLLISNEEIEILWELTLEEGRKKPLTEYGVSLTYITLGPKGCDAITASHHATVNSPSDIQVIDTTGAGDIFGGSAMSQFLQ